jgi:hypothetical protein
MLTRCSPAFAALVSIHRLPGEGLGCLSAETYGESATSNFNNGDVLIVKRLSFGATRAAILPLLV